MNTLVFPTIANVTTTYNYIYIYIWLSQLNSLQGPLDQPSYTYIFIYITIWNSSNFSTTKINIGASVGTKEPHIFSSQTSARLGRRDVRSKVKKNCGNDGKSYGKYHRIGISWGISWIFETDLILDFGQAMSSSCHVKFRVFHMN